MLRRGSTRSRSRSRAAVVRLDWAAHTRLCVCCAHTLTHAHTTLLFLLPHATTTTTKPSTDVPGDVDVVVAPPFIYIDYVRANLKSTYAVAAQNCWMKPDGAFTGEISAEMLKDALVPYGE